MADQAEPVDPAGENGHEERTVVEVSNPGTAADLRAKILATKDQRTKVVNVPEWAGVDVEVRSLDGDEWADARERYVDQDSGEVDFRAAGPEIVIRTCYHPTTGERIFDAGDAGVLNTKLSGVVERLSGIALELSGLTQEARQRAGKGS